MADLRIGNSFISAASSVRNLGATFDTIMSMEMHMNNVCRSAMAHVRNIIDIRPSLIMAATEKLVHALVISRLDSNNVLLYGLPATQLDRIQSVQNIAQVICEAHGHNSVASQMILDQSLHWLSIWERRHCKVLLLTFKILHGDAWPRHIWQFY